ncbi:MAG: hypothetical protein IKR92_01845 [Alphaproteobacteria bacterium]|nr:hypothetical protein [Alphaproteobacteria bacterium]
MMNIGFMSGAQMVIANEVINGNHSNNNVTARDSIRGAFQLLGTSLVIPIILAIVFGICTILPEMPEIVYVFAIAIILIGGLMAEVMNWELYQAAVNTIDKAKKVKTKLIYGVTAIIIGVFVASPMIALAYYYTNCYNETTLNYPTMAMVAILVGWPLIEMINILWRMYRYKTRH